MGYSLLNILDNFKIIDPIFYSFFACMVGSHLVLIQWIISDKLIGFRIFQRKEECVIYCGLILMIGQVKKANK